MTELDLSMHLFISASRDKLLGIVELKYLNSVTTVISN